MAGKPKDSLQKDKQKPSFVRRIRSFLFRLGIAMLAFVVFCIFLSYPHWMMVKQQTIDMADQHRQYFASHAGWSYPGTIWSDSVPLTADKNRLVAHAKLRNYTAQCPASDPGTYCKKEGQIIPRGGMFPEGVQPPGKNGWTRPLALEPIQIGMLIGEEGELREHLPIKEAPKLLIDALLASEDENFYQHSGVHVISLIRAFVINLQTGSYTQGASTIHMQVIRNLSQHKDKTLIRKLDEIAAAYFLNQYLSKEEVLQLYINIPYLGQHKSYPICGFAMAAKHYFNKDIRNISLDEAALLVGILPAPGIYRPDANPEGAKERRNLVLQRMAITKKYRIGEALQKPIAVTRLQLPEPLYPDFLSYTYQWLKERYDNEVLYGSGLQVFTSLDVVLQERSKKYIPIWLKSLQEKSGHLYTEPLEAAASLIDTKTGYLISLYGGSMAHHTDFNRATQAKRQAGSSFKPLVYALAFSRTNRKGKPLWKSFDTVRNDKHTFQGTDGWRPRNTSGYYSKTSSLAAGLARSLNIATADLLQRSGGPAPLLSFAKEFGFDTSDFAQEMGLALGQAETTPLEIARFVATIANGGKRTKAHPVISARDLLGRERILTSNHGKELLTRQSTALVRELMRLVVTSGTGYSTRGVGLFPGYTGSAIGKTGTTDQNKDLWFVGATPAYASSLWIGTDKPINLYASSSDYAAPLWGWWMHQLHKDIEEDKDFSGLRLNSVPICRESGKTPNKTCPLIQAPILDGQAPNGTCSHRHPKVEKKYFGLWYTPPEKKTTRRRKKRASTTKEKTVDQQRQELIEERKEEESVVPPVPFE